jgi:hypothetical protein
MARSFVCDVCRKPTERIVGKLHYIPLDKKDRTTHSDYTHHADVGTCCAGRALELLNFRPRQTRAEYMASRKGQTVA